MRSVEDEPDEVPDPRAPLTASELRRHLAVLALRRVRLHNLPHDLATGGEALLFGCDEAGRHGNFLTASYEAITHGEAARRLGWASRLTKPHTAYKRQRARANWPWCEVDSFASSDALLMNVFCHPLVFDGERLSAPVTALLGVTSEAAPRFGVLAGVPLAGRTRSLRKADPGRPKLDRTEIDLVLATEAPPCLYLEAKLTESGFQTANLAKLTRYRNLAEVFDIDALPWTTEAMRREALLAERARRGYLASPLDDFTHIPEPAPRPATMEGYQLVRNVLAAHADGASFCLLTDARRHDLIEAWYRILRAVHTPELSIRLKLLTWQELAAVLPAELQEFLAEKYGILPDRPATRGALFAS